VELGPQYDLKNRYVIAKADARQKKLDFYSTYLGRGGHAFPDMDQFVLIQGQVMNSMLL
jgi:hypothetical protein